MRKHIFIPELPEWIENHAIHIFSGVELVAYKNKDGNWFVKTGRCNWCGKCCQNLNDNFVFPVVNGQCIHLKKEPGNNDQWLCGLGINRPFGCSIGIPSKIKHPYCTEEYEEVKDNGNL